ncbi:TIGR01621 family pseudouridine synthase [Thermodesulfobacteriota bacterium]
MMYKVIYENEAFLIVDKSPGVSFHKEDNSPGLTTRIKTDLLLTQLYAIHRLDKITSGILLFAKTKPTARELSVKFSNRDIEKYYLALSDRRPRKKQGLIQGGMQKSRRGAWKLLRSKVNPSITQFFSKSIGQGLRLFILKPSTGRTHQLRVAMKSIGAPVLGDPLYYKSSLSNEGVDRGYLHAYALRLSFGERSYSFVNVPEIGNFFKSDYFKESLGEYSRPWELKWPPIRTKT